MEQKDKINPPVTTVTDSDRTPLPGSGEAPHELECPVCGKQCSSRSGYTRHVRTHDQQPSSSNGQSTSSGGGNRHECIECDKVFSTAQGLALHKSKMHRETYNSSIPVARKKARWDIQDKILLAKLESNTIVKLGKVPDDINLRLSKAMPERTFDSIKSMRRGEPYKALVERELQKLRVPASSHLMTATDSVAATSPDHQEERRSLKVFVKQLTESIRPIDDESKDLITLAQKFVEGESYVELLNEFLRRHFLSPPKSSPPKDQGKDRILSKRRQRREEYAKIQTLFHKNRSACAQMVLDGEASVNVNDGANFTEYWATMMTSTPPPPMGNRGPFNANGDFQNLANPISLEEVAAALKGPAKAVGPDGVKLKKLRDTKLANLCCVLNILYASPVPEPHQAARVAFIPKTAEASKPEHFRPISIGSYFQRVMNKILARRMQATLNISELQRAFLPYDGTYENLNIIDSIIKDARRNRQELRLVSIDLRKAFDMVSHDAIISTLYGRGYPASFIDYVTNLYAGSTTKIQYGGSTRCIHPTRGVRQGDPLSPLLFDLVLDDAFKSLSHQGFGYKIDEGCVLGVAYADDVILTTQSKATMQSLLDIAIPMLEARGLSINADKSFSVSIVGAGKTKKVKVVDSPEFKVGDSILPCKSVGAEWKYLGVFLDDRGRLPPSCGTLDKFLDRISAAPLKPAQRLAILKDFLVPRFIHRLVCGRTPTANLLRALDQSIRNVVKRKWLHLESSIPTGFLYAKVAHGGLGLPCLLTLVPRLRLARMTKLSRSSYTTAKWACSTESFEADLARTRKLCRALHRTVETARQERDYWAWRLHSTFDGAHYKMAEKRPDVHRWVLGMPYLSGREYIHLVKCRINALPTRARLARGRPAYNRQCRHGCEQVETLNHVTQTCKVTHLATVKRHDDVCRTIARVLGKSGYEVQRERLYREPNCPGLKPDLVVITSDTVHVLDVEICGTSRDLHKARRDKIEKYEVEWLARRLPHPGRRRVYGSITISSTGVWHPDSASDLEALKFTKARLADLTVQVVQGTLRVFRSHRDHKS